MLKKIIIKKDTPKQIVKKFIEKKNHIELEYTMSYYRCAFTLYFDKDFYNAFKIDIKTTKLRYENGYVTVYIVIKGTRQLLSQVVYSFYNPDSYDRRCKISFKDKNNLNLKQENMFQNRISITRPSILYYNFDTLCRCYTLLHKTLSRNKVGYDIYFHEVDEATVVVSLYKVLTNEVVQTIIDRDKFSLVKNLRISAHLDSHTRKFYAKYFDSDTKGSKQLHRLIMNLNDIDLQVDHKNLDTMDNRILNLKRATTQDNVKNQGLRSDNKTGRKGIRIENTRSGKRIVSSARHNGKLNTKRFSVNKYGYDLAWKMANQVRDEFEALYEIRKSTVNKR